MFIHVKSALKGKILSNNRKKHFKIRSIFKNHGRVLYKKVIKDVSENLSFKFEIILVKSIGRENLCNLTDGGENPPHGFGEENSNYGNCWSEKQKENLRKKMLGRYDGKDNPNYGNRMRISKKVNMKIKKSKIIVQFDLDGKEIKKYLGSGYAARITGTNRGSITACACGYNITAGGFLWRYCEN
jgi:hypothetical protein